MQAIPLLKTEKHNRIRLTADSRNDYYNGYMNSLAGAGWNVGGTLVADKVKDLIIFDRAHGQSGTASKDGGIITRNVDARLFTAQAYARYNFNPHWAAGIKAAYNYGHNETDGRPPYQIRPFEAAVQADYKTTLPTAATTSARQHALSPNKRAVILIWQAVWA